jgi:antitoxin component of RelBE/YafQ-DinJ toxin-antitoxin module
MQIVVDESELRQFRRVARRLGLTLAEWVRQTLRKAGREEPLASTDKQLAAIRAAARHRFPAPDIGKMLAEIERGYASGIEE